MIDIILLLLIIFLLFCLSMIWPPDSPWAPWWRTSRMIARAMCKLAKVTEKDHIYDLGSGDGEALMTAAQEYGATGVGIEIDPVRSSVSQTRVNLAKMQDRITILRKNFFDVDISRADVIFVYLVPKALARLREKFLSELKPGTRIVSYRYEVPYLKPVETDPVHQLYLYTIPKSKQKTK